MIADSGNASNLPSKEEALQEVRDFFEQDRDLPDELKTELLRSPERFVEERQVRAAMPSGRPGKLGASYWAVRNDQLDLAKHLSGAAMALVTFAVVAASSPYVPAAVVILALLDIARRLRKKKVTLSDDHYRVLLVLKQTGPKSVGDLAAILNGIRGTGGGSLSEDAVAALLKELSAIRAHDQTLEELVVQAGDGLWSTNGV